MSLLDVGYSIAGWMEQTIPLGYRSLDVGRLETYTLIDQLREQAPVDMVCAAFGINRSCYYEHRQRVQRVDAERVALRARVNEMFNKSRSSAGSRTIQGLLNPPTSEYLPPR